MSRKRGYPNIIEDTEVNVKALVEAVVLTEQVQAKVRVAGRHHHRCRWRHRRLIVQQSCLTSLLGKEKTIFVFAHFAHFAHLFFTCKAKRVSSLSSSINQIAGQTLQEKYFPASY